MLENEAIDSITSQINRMMIVNEFSFSRCEMSMTTVTVCRHKERKPNTMRTRNGRMQEKSVNMDVSLFNFAGTAYHAGGQCIAND